MNESDVALLIANAQNINAIIKSIKIITEREDEEILKHVAAITVHLFFFIKDVLSSVNHQSLEISEEMKDFLEICGCNMKEKINDNKRS